MGRKRGKEKNSTAPESHAGMQERRRRYDIPKHKMRIKESSQKDPGRCTCLRDGLLPHLLARVAGGPFLSMTFTHKPLPVPPHAQVPYLAHPGLCTLVSSPVQYHWAALKLTQKWTNSNFFQSQVQTSGLKWIGGQ
jgi:hypothetical protein